MKVFREDGLWDWMKGISLVKRLVCTLDDFGWLPRPTRSPPLAIKNSSVILCWLDSSYKILTPCTSVLL